MKKTVRIFLLIAILTGEIFTSFAVKIPKKKAAVTFNIKSPSSFRSSLNFNLKTGLRYTGSLTSPATASGSLNTNTLITYTKGKSVYILPYKQKVFVADARQGYAGTKLIIRPR